MDMILFNYQILIKSINFMILKSFKLSSRITAPKQYQQLKEHQKEIKQQQKHQVNNLINKFDAKKRGTSQILRYQIAINDKERSKIDLKNYKPHTKDEMRKSQFVNYENNFYKNQNLINFEQRYKLQIQRQIQRQQEIHKLIQLLRTSKQQTNFYIQKNQQNKQEINHLLGTISSLKQEKRKMKIWQKKSSHNMLKANSPSQDKKQQNTKQLSEPNEQFREKQQNLSHNNHENQEIKIQIQHLKNHISQMRSKQSQKDKKINVLSYNLKQKEKELQNIQKKLLQIQQERLMKQRQITKQQKQSSQQKYYQKDACTHRNLSKQLENQKRISYNLNKEIQSLKGQAYETLQQLENQKRISSNLANEIKSQRTEVQRISKQLEGLKAVSYNLSNKISSVSRYDSLFTGDVLDQSKQCKEYLTSILQQKIGLRISKTKLIYRFDPYSKSNFHQYFDNKEQLVLLVRTINDVIFGGWTEGGFIPKTKSDKSGLLFSLTNKQCFELSQPNRKAITYDEFHIIFGNSEIVIQSLKDEVSSNFGITNGFYDCRGYTVDLMLGIGEAKEVKIKTYEIFQLSLQKK